MPRDRWTLEHGSGHAGLVCWTVFGGTEVGTKDLPALCDDGYTRLGSVCAHHPSLSARAHSPQGVPACHQPLCHHLNRDVPEQQRLRAAGGWVLPQSCSRERTQPGPEPTVPPAWHSSLCFHCSFGTTISTWPWLSSPRSPCSWRTSPRPNATVSWPSESPPRPASHTSGPCPGLPPCHEARDFGMSQLGWAHPGLQSDADGPLSRQVRGHESHDRSIHPGHVVQPR